MWKTDAAPPKAEYGEYLQLNYSMVDEGHLGKMMDSIASSGGIRPRASQIDCWWYPTTKQHQFYCGTDWVLPKQFYPNGMAGGWLFLFLYASNIMLSSNLYTTGGSLTREISGWVRGYALL